MRTTLNIDENVIKDLMRITGAKSKSQAVNQALGAYVRERRIQGLLALRGKLHLDDNWRELREMEKHEA